MAKERERLFQPEYESSSLQYQSISRSWESWVSFPPFFCRTCIFAHFFVLFSVLLYYFDVCPRTTMNTIHTRRRWRDLHQFSEGPINASVIGPDSVWLELSYRPHRLLPSTPIVALINLIAMAPGRKLNALEAKLHQAALEAARVISVHVYLFVLQTLIRHYWTASHSERGRWIGYWCESTNRSHEFPLGSGMSAYLSHMVHA